MNTAIAGGVAVLTSTLVLLVGLWGRVGLKGKAYDRNTAFMDSGSYSVGSHNTGGYSTGGYSTGSYGMGSHSVGSHSMGVYSTGSLSKRVRAIVCRPFLLSGEYYFLKLRALLGGGTDGALRNRDRERLKGILVKEEVEDCLYEFHVQNAAIAIAGIFLASFILLMAGIIEAGNSASEISSVKRPDYGSLGKDYNITVTDEYGNEESLIFNLGSRKYSEEETELIFDKCFQAVKEKMLGENRSFQEVETDLDFSGLEDWAFIQVSFYSSDMGLIGEGGEVNCQAAGNSGSQVTITVMLQYEEYVKNYEIPVIVLHKDSDSLKGLSGYLKQEEELLREEEYYELPAFYNGLKLRYFSNRETGNILLLALLCVLVSWLLIAGRKNRLKENYKKRNDQLEADYPELVSKMIVLMRSGMPVRSVFLRIAADYDRDRSRGGEFHYVYEEMRLSIKEMENGDSEEQVYLRFGKRCGLTSYMKLGNMLFQNLRKGSQSIASLLEEERILAVDNAGRSIRVKGQLVGTKLMLPMVVLFALVMAIIMVPAVMSFQV